MYACNDTVTLWHREKIDGKDVFARRVLEGCKWSDKIARAVQNNMSSGGKAQLASSVQVVIPYNPDIVCAVGDIMALGEHTGEITGERGCAAADIKAALKPNVMTVNAIADYTRNPKGKHFLVEGT